MSRMSRRRKTMSRGGPTTDAHPAHRGRGQGRVILKGLKAEGHSLERTSTAADGLSLAASQDYDLVLLDLMLPDASGRDVLDGIRREKPEMPVIVVSALDGVASKVELLDAGADDYIVKPFAFAELAARIRAQVRQGSSSRVLEAGRLRLDTVSRVASLGGSSIDLPAREFSLLEYLMRHQGQVLTRQQVLDAVWGYDFDPESNVVDVYVGYLRRKLDPPDGSSIIETIRGVGFRIRA